MQHAKSFELINQIHVWDLILKLIIAISFSEQTEFKREKLKDGQKRKTKNLIKFDQRRKRGKNEIWEM